MTSWCLPGVNAGSQRGGFGQAERRHASAPRIPPVIPACAFSQNQRLLLAATVALAPSRHGGWASIRCSSSSSFACSASTYRSPKTPRRCVHPSSGVPCTSAIPTRLSSVAAPPVLQSPQDRWESEHLALVKGHLHRQCRREVVFTSSEGEHHASQFVRRCHVDRGLRIGDSFSSQPGAVRKCEA